MKLQWKLNFKITVCKNSVYILEWSTSINAMFSRVQCSTLSWKNIYIQWNLCSGNYPFQNAKSCGFGHVQTTMIFFFFIVTHSQWIDPIIMCLQCPCVRLHVRTREIKGLKVDGGSQSRSTKGINRHQLVALSLLVVNPILMTTYNLRLCLSVYPAPASSEQGFIFLCPEK